MLKAKLLKPTDHAGLRRFGISIGLALPLIFMAFLPWLFNYSTPLWPVLIPLWLLPLGLAAAMAHAQQAPDAPAVPVVEEAVPAPVVAAADPQTPADTAAAAARRPPSQRRPSALAMRFLPTVGLGTLPGKWLNHARTSSSSPMPCM